MTDELVIQENRQVAESGYRSIIDRAVAERLDVAQLEKLLELQERFEKREAFKAFTVALAEFKANPPDIFRNADGYNKHRFATLDNCCGEINPALAKHGLSFRWETEQTEKGAVKVTCILTHDLGHSECAVLIAMPDTSGNKNPIQAIGSTVTYLQRYTLLTATGMAVQGQDDDGRAAGKQSESEQAADRQINAQEVKDLLALMNKVKPNTDGFYRYFRIAEIGEMKVSQLKKAYELLNAKKEGKTRA